MDDPTHPSSGGANGKKSRWVEAGGWGVLAASSLCLSWLWPGENDLLSEKNLLRACLIFIGLLFLRLYNRQVKTKLEMSRKELLLEIEELKTDTVNRKIRLSMNSPYKPVADMINQLGSLRERQTRQLTEQHHHQQVLLNNMSEGIVVLDNDQRITGINPSAARWLELGNSARIQGEVFYTRCRNPILLKMIEEITTSRTTLKESYLRLERLGMQDRVVKVKASPLIDHDQTLGVLLLLQDVTTLQQLETLRQDFVANVSHELRTPLTSIKGYAELISDEPEDSETVERFMGKILNQSTRMVNIIDDLLSLTRIENAEAQTALQLTEIKPILERVLHLCEEQAALRELEIRIECDEQMKAELHPPLFEQAVHNLVYNAIKYTHPSTLIRLKAIASSREIRLEVIDQGPGIPLSDQSRIFERFYRVDKARSRAIGGTGLGLSIVKHISLLHQGKVGVESTPGKGSTFWISLPGTVSDLEK